MYAPNNFKQTDIRELIAIMREYPFATLITHSISGIEANHLPVTIVESDGGMAIHAHIAKANKLWQSVEQGADVLLIFNGPNCYVSPNYYPTKKENGRAVPTWNYVVVHVKGNISFIHDEQWVYRMLDTLTKEHEAEQISPWSITDAPVEYIDKMLSAIVGIEISIDEIEGKWKLSQNQPDVNKLGVMQRLIENGQAQQVKISELINDLQ
ncbi:FMN-binding negative transcriptional regulator [Psychrosphaera aquimarina]|uniref:FMN-binding negative transcriptional regulator n=1 Tax=Psychrosphaera aquimarina TaxID=2044854 RepID=A0ABU3QZW6_9GAMM|nr:FMN-binding negative transcriptional regulator [Psychrosphaera aquimarina]MDU0112700.1 FMN-binding negative transcriptional regulator [Psychrosphaera aquimarina]